MKTVKVVKEIYNKQILELILKTRGIDHQFISFINNEGMQDYAYMVYIDKYYSQDVCGGYISYNKDKSMTRVQIDQIKKEMGFIEPFEDGVLYEVDAYPIYQDFIKFPIRNVEFITEEELCKKLVMGVDRSFYDYLMK